MFMNHNPAPRRTLADIILEKITEKQTELQTQFSDAGSEYLFYSVSIIGCIPGD